MLRTVSRLSVLRPSRFSLGGHARMFSTVPETPKATVVEDYSCTDTNYEDTLVNDGSRRQFTYLMLGGARFVYATAVRLVVMRFVGSMTATADVLALASLEVGLEKIKEGTTATVKWRGKPVFIRHRTDDEISTANSVDISTLRDPESDAERVIDPKWLVTLAICTHLGCVPLSDAGEYKAWFCPCHGSHYDISGRIRKGPAPLNLEIPPYKFIEDQTKVLIG